MHCKSTILILSVALILLEALSIGNCLSSNVEIHISDRAASYLLNCTYNPTMGLCSEVNGSRGNHLNFNGDIFNIGTDNMFSWIALAPYNLTISNEIKNTVISYVHKYKLPHDSNFYPITYKHDSIYGDNLSLSMPLTANFSELTHGILNGTPYQVWTEIDNSSTSLNVTSSPWKTWNECADEWAWQGMSYLDRHNRTEAKACYDSMMNMWDGYGFNDINARTYGYYEPFKLALAIIFSKRSGFALPEEGEIINILAMCQNQTTGGIATGYTMNSTQFSTKGHIDNTETTALVVIAGVTRSSVSSNVNVLALLLGCTVAAVIVTAVVVEVRARYKDRNP